jgi:dihydrofolate synthase/folylpolyglutamate synthase
VVQLVDRVLALEPALTFFEVVTAVAFAFFAQRGVEVALVETGLGGRLDATNVIKPIASVLTRIDLDHTEVLGHTLLHVAREKAGIIKAAVPVIAAPCDREVERMLKRRCGELSSPLWLMGRDFRGRAAGRCFDFQGPLRSLEDLTLSLEGRHQQENAALCLATLERLGQQGFPVNEEQARRGLQEDTWPGRLEWIDGHLLDGAHNPGAAAALADALDTIPGANRRELCLVLGLLEGRDVDSMLRPLLPRVRGVIFSRPRSPRAVAPEKLARRAASLAPGARVTEGLPAALELARSEGRTCLITGSLYLVGEAISLLRGEPTDPWPTGDPQPGPCHKLG